MHFVLYPIVVRFLRRAVSLLLSDIRSRQYVSALRQNVRKLSTGIDTKGLLQAVDTAVEMVKEEKNGGAIPVPDYADINVSDKVVKIIQSYVGVVNKMVWRKDV